MLGFRLVTHPHRVHFTVALDDPRILEQLQFVHLIMMKFDGEIDDDTVARHENSVWWDVTFSDDAYKATSDAMDWCKLNLDDGQVKETYLGALERADPHAFAARDLLNTLNETDEK